MSNAVIVAAARTPVGKFGGSLAKIPASDLGAVVIKEVLKRAGVKPEQVDEVIMGQVLTAGVGQNAARQALIKAGLPVTVPGTTINKVCGSGLKAVMLAAQAIANGDAEIVVAGGQENMSASPHVMQGSRDGYRMGDAKIIDSMIVDGLWDVYNQYHMGITAENVAKEHKVDRATQDQFALASQQKAAAAQDAGRFKEEIVAVPIPQRKGDPISFDADEFINRKTNRGSFVGTEAGVRQARQCDGGQCVRTERRRRRAAGDVGSESEGARANAAGQDQGVRVGRRRSEGDGHGARAGVAQGVEESGLDGRPSRSDGNQRSVRRASVRGQQGHGLEYGEDQRERRCDCARSSDRRLRRPHPRDVAARDEAARCEKRLGRAVYRRRHGGGAGGRALICS